MINLEFLVKKLTGVSQAAIDTAAAACVGKKCFEVGIEHLLLALLRSPDCDAFVILRSQGVDTAVLSSELSHALQRMPSGNSRSPSLAPRLIRLLTHAWTIASLEFGCAHIRSAILLLALLETDDLLRPVAESSGEIRKLSAAAVREQWLVSRHPAEDESISDFGASAEPDLEGASKSALDQFTVDLTLAARKGNIDPVIGREQEIRQIVDILTRRRQNNPILTGEAGVGKTAVVEGFALRVATSDVPPSLRDVAVRSLDMGLLQAGAGVRGEFEARLKAVISAIKQLGGQAILFIDEAHTLIGGGGAAGQNDAANLLKPALARGELRVIAATTFAEYRKYFERDAALARRFQVVRVDEPSEELAIRMVRGLAPLVERHHGVRVLDEAVQVAVRLSHRYVTGRQLPDKAVNVLDTACARVALGQTATPPALEDCRQRIDLLEQEITALKREASSGADHTERLHDLFNELAAAETQLADLEDRCAGERALVRSMVALRTELENEPAPEREKVARDEMEAARAELAEMQGETPLIQPFVEARAVAEVISSWTGVPVGQMVQDELHTVLRLQNLLAARVVGQDQALEAIARRVRTARAGLEDPERPTGVFLLVGPSGVGKTETALALADVLYGGERSAVIINMSEYQEAHSVSGLKGSPPGYVGYGEGGVLTEAVRRRPYCLLLLDEMEKAHPDVMELFYQVFDKGKMEDSQGREIDFRNTIILATSNTGSATIQRLCSRPGNPPSLEDLQRSVGPELRSVFKPALLGRMIIVPYFPIGDKGLRRIIELKLDKIGGRLEQSYRIAFSYTDALVDEISKRCVEVESGARNVDHILTGTLLPEISRRLLTATASHVSFQRISADVGPSGALRFTIE
ncbi:MAG: type secretion system protein VasG [Bryobacterales bacterium]|jgi:type VI secretion system protein VasG|nr:type secretion system protein VasG [Bryobacterales bacterium]